MPSDRLLVASWLQSTEGGTSRFGALATVLNQKLAPRWKMFTPPYAPSTAPLPLATALRSLRLWPPLAPSRHVPPPPPLTTSPPPPLPFRYVLLLIRTFLTLEGIAARVDPDFNIYEMAMPWAVRRSLSPGSAEGIATLRSTFLTSDNRVQVRLACSRLLSSALPPISSDISRSALFSPCSPDLPLISLRSPLLSPCSRPALPRSRPISPDLPCSGNACSS